ncbi:hypothetical protein Pmani_004589 [Petrolisthes manimaculis]|uniref:BHLH domain-containing protein n=1 Tax=Petrolisthes manimaculis TaxID=1843537 RepID=A0AAE1QDZ3_9EUCA|nr:hypothetical protein Pmani_004589 [Petrolisthes manimaculis]
MARSEQDVRGKEGSPVDTNNNTSNSNTSTRSDNIKDAGGCGGKYQLRPRALQARRRSDSEWDFQDSLRHKPRPLPLSRYRRKTANARERYRMRQINRAFESLRGVLPAWVCSRRAAADMTKITTLRLASAYIRSLKDILDGAESQDNSWVLSSILSDAGVTEDPSPQLSGQEDPLQDQRLCPDQDTELVTLLCNMSDAVVLQDNLESSYLTPMSETEAVALLLGSESSSPWQDHHHMQVKS